MMNVGDTVTVRGSDYRMIAKRPAGEGKFFGKFVFILRDVENNEFRALGKTVMHNSKIIPNNR